MAGRTATMIEKSLVLWRGESPERNQALKTRGLIPEDRWRSNARLWAMYPQLVSRNLGTVLDSLVELVRGHVLQQDAMPFFSFTTDRRAAERYALTRYDGHAKQDRPSGLLLRMPVLFVAEYRETLREQDGPACVLVDDQGRCWVEASRFVNATGSVEPDVDPFDELTGDVHEPDIDIRDPGEVDAHFAGGDEGLARYRARRDSEYLVVGSVEPTEYQCCVIRASPTLFVR